LKNYINEVIIILYYILTSLEIFEKVQRYKTLFIQTLFFIKNTENEKSYCTPRRLIRINKMYKKPDHNVGFGFVHPYSTHRLL